MAYSSKFLGGCILGVQYLSNFIKVLGLVSGSAGTRQKILDFSETYQLFPGIRDKNITQTMI